MSYEVGKIKNENVAKGFIEKLEEFLNTEVEQARKAKNEVRKAKISYDAANAKLQAATKKEALDPIGQYINER